jgi:hypothetical protein
MTARPPAPLDGLADRAFRDLADAFAQSVASGVERGGLAVRIGGKTVLDLLVAPGGLRPQGRQKDLRVERARSAGADAILGVPVRYGEGVELSLPPGIDFGPRTSTLGYWRAGGATGFADPDAALAFGYVTGEMEPGLRSSPRAGALVAALYRCL